MKLVIMTKPTFFVEEDKILASLFDEGMDNLHLCKPESSPMYSERLLTLLPEDSYGKISVHDHFYLKEEYKLRGIHIDNAAEIPNKYKGRVSRTCHTLDELKEAKKKSDYVFLDRVFDDDTHKAAFSTEELLDAAHNGLIDRKVYAVGGITLDTIRAAHETGFGGVVVCEDLWDRFDIHHGIDFKELMTHFERLKKAVS